MGIFVTNTNKLRMTEVWTHIAVLWFSFVLVTQARCKNLRKRNSSLLDTFNHRGKHTRLYPFWTNNFIRSYIHAGRIVRSGVAEGFTKFTGRVKRETSNNGHKTKLGRKVSTALPQPAKPLRVVATSAVIKNRRRKPPPLKAIHIWGATPFNTVLRNLQMLNAKIQKQGGAVKRLFLPVQIQRTQFLNALSKQSVPRQMQPFTRPDGFLNVNGPGIIPAPLSGIHFQQGPPPQPPLLHLPDPVRRLPPVMPLPSFRGTGPGQVLEPAAGYDFHSVHDDSPVQGMEAMNDMGPTSISEITPPIENNPTAETRAMSEEPATRDLTPTIEYDNDPQFGPKSFETTPNFETPSGVFGPPPPPVSWLAGEIHEEVNRHVKKGVSQARCSPNPCKNDGRCTAFEERYECDCPIGFMGKNCQDVNHCLPNPCKNEGNCYATSYGYHCTCVKGFKGPNCDIFSKCTSNPCKNGGTCEDGRDSYKCSCLPGFKGSKCEATDHCSNGNPCKNGGTCLNGESRFECKCLPGYNGLDCGDVDVCYSNPCQNSGTCHNTGAGQFICQCLITFRGITCEEKIPKCESQPCQNGGTCVENDREEEGFYCKCLEKYQGKHCQEMQGPCSKNPCLNDGKCIEIEETFRCVCKDGFNGSTCEVKVLPVVPLCTGCHKYAVCVDGKCACKAGYLGNGNVCEEPTDSNYTMNYAKKTTSPILPTPGRTQLVMNSCHPNPCYNGGTCHKNDVGFDCECPLNYIGTLCKGIRPCLSNPCQNEGTCIDEGLLDDYVCKCKNGYKGKNCEDAGVCEPNPCHNGGTCQQKRSSYVCQCNERFEGSTCAEDKCGKCDVHAHCETGKCVCDVGFYGNGIRGECYRAGASNPRFCVPNPCLHGGSCYEKPNGHSCQCASGYQGNYCELSIGNNAGAAPTQRPPDPCAGYPCLNDGRCVPKGKKFQCMCLRGFQGATCEQRSKSYCHPNPCLHGGSCTDATDGYSCRCIGSYRGTNCEVDDCDQCDVHAICVQGACRCRVGFKGDGFQCEKLKRCRRCSPNATCINDECVCKPGFIGNGKHCQKDDCKGCPPHSHCVRGICICVPGFYFNGHRCVAAMPKPPTTRHCPTECAQKSPCGRGCPSQCCQAPKHPKVQTCPTYCSLNCRPPCPNHCCNVVQPSYQPICPSNCQNSCHQMCPTHCCTVSTPSSALCPSSCKDSCDSSCPSHCCRTPSLPTVAILQPTCNPICHTNCLSSCSKECCKITIVPVSLCPSHCKIICVPSCPSYCCSSKQLPSQQPTPYQELCPTFCSSSCNNLCPKFCCKVTLLPSIPCPSTCSTYCHPPCPQNCCQRPFLPDSSASAANACPEQCENHCGITCPLECCQGLTKLEQPIVHGTPAVQTSLWNEPVTLTGNVTTSPSTTFPCPDFCSSLCRRECPQYCCKRSPRPFLFSSPAKSVSPVGRSLKTQDSDYKSKVLLHLSKLLSSPLQFCDSLCFLNCSETCPRTCCDVRRKRKMYIFKRKKKTQISSIN